MGLLLYLLLLCSLLSVSNYTLARDVFQFAIKSPQKRVVTKSVVKTHHALLPLHTALISVHYANAMLLTKQLSQQKLGLLSKRGQVIYFAHAHQLWIKDDRIHLQRIIALIKQLDTPPAEILIQARIVNIDDRYMKALGAILGTKNNNIETKGGLQFNLPAIAASAANISFPIIALGSQTVLNLQLSALENSGHAQLVASPKLLTLNHSPAVIEAGDEIPFQEQNANGGTSIVFKKAVLRLKVTPIVMPQAHLLLKIMITQDTPAAQVANEVPAIRTQQLKTQAIVANQQTLVLGGINEKAQSQQHTGVPFLKKIPLLGLLFRQKKATNHHKQLLLFVTPSIVNTKTSTSAQIQTDT